MSSRSNGVTIDVSNRLRTARITSSPARSATMMVCTRSATTGSDVISFSSWIAVSAAVAAWRSNSG